MVFENTPAPEKLVVFLPYVPVGDIVNIKTKNGKKNARRYRNIKNLENNTWIARLENEL